MPLPLPEQAWFERAAGYLTPALLSDTVRSFVDIPSPTGEERELAERIVELGRSVGVESTVQLLSADHANAVLSLGNEAGPALLLYAPIDTHLSDHGGEDLAWSGADSRGELRATSQVDGHFVVGLGASNPKGHAACIAAVLHALALACVPLAGKVIAGFGGGGMPTNGRPEGRVDVGNGSGCTFMLDRGVQADHAIIAKPGRSVSWEEVGLDWVKISVTGDMGYVGVRHRMPGRTVLEQAAEVIAGLEKWFPEYTERHTSGTLSPQGMVGALHGGWSHKPAFSPAVCEIYVDLRLHPDTTPVSAFRELSEVLRGLQVASTGCDIRAELILSIPGTRTPVESDVVRSCIDAWEEVYQVPHEPALGLSGATDANILRRGSLPTARLGMPPLSSQAPLGAGFAQSMNVVDLREMLKLSKALLYCALDLCGTARS